MTRPRQFDLICLRLGWHAVRLHRHHHALHPAAVVTWAARAQRQAASYVIGMALMPALAQAAPDVPPEQYPELAALPPPLLQAPGRHQPVRRRAAAAGRAARAPPLAGGGHRQEPPRPGRGAGQRQLRGVFDGSRTADETAGKPDPRMLHELMAEFGAEPERTLMIGDTTHDLQMAQNAGCASVGVSYGAHPPGASPRWPRASGAFGGRAAGWLDEHA
jgi:phosphoglycolate phosphatase